MSWWNTTVSVLFLTFVICHADQNATRERENVRIGIVGGGIAGLVAANRLIEYGFTNVTILEASNRLGGRIYPVQFESGYLQLGAEFISGKCNSIYKLASRKGFLHGAYEPFSDVRFETGQCQVLDSVVDTYFDFAWPLEDKYRVDGNSSDLNATQTVGELYGLDYKVYLEQLGLDSRSSRLRIMDALSRLYRASYECEWSANWNDLSVKNLVKWYNERKDVHAMDRYGYKTILDYLKKQLSPSSIKLNHRATFIDYGLHMGVRVSFRSVDDDQFYDHLIVTVPLGHLKKFAYHNFRPPLPVRKQAAIDKLGFGSIGKVFFVYKEPFWDKKTTTIVTLSVANCSSTAPVPEIDSFFQYFQTYRWNKKVLLGWLSGDGPAKVSAMSDDRLKSAVTELFRRQFNNASIPMPTEIYRANWTSDVLFGGTHSYISVAAVEANVTFKDLARPLYIRGVPRLLFAGEATHDSAYQTTVGAWCSGRREATRLLRYYKTRYRNTARPLYPLRSALLIVIYTMILARNALYV